MEHEGGGGAGGSGAQLPALDSLELPVASASLAGSPPSPSSPGSLALGEDEGGVGEEEAGGGLESARPPWGSPGGLELGASPPEGGLEPGATEGEVEPGMSSPKGGVELGGRSPSPMSVVDEEDGGAAARGGGGAGPGPAPPTRAARSAARVRPSKFRRLDPEGIGVDGAGADDGGVGRSAGAAANPGGAAPLPPTSTGGFLDSLRIAAQLRREARLRGPAGGGAAARPAALLAPPARPSPPRKRHAPALARPSAASPEEQALEAWRLEAARAARGGEGEGGGGPGVDGKRRRTGERARDGGGPHSASLPGAPGREVAGPRVSRWRPPASPFGLLEEELWTDPWRVLVACVLLNKTHGNAVRPRLWDLFRAFPNGAEDVARDPERSRLRIESIIASLGLHRLRAQAIVRLSVDYLSEPWNHAIELHGVGRYADDAHRIFCLGLWRSTDPEDKDLVRYIDWLRRTDGLGQGLQPTVAPV